MNVNDLICLIQNKLLEFAEGKINNLYYYYKFDKDEKIKKLFIYLRGLQYINRLELLGYESCLDEEQFSCLHDKIINITGARCSTYCLDYIKDESNLTNNSECKSFQPWERYSALLGTKVKLTAKRINIDDKLVVTAVREVIQDKLKVIADLVMKDESLEVDVVYKNIEKKLKLTSELTIHNNKLSLEAVKCITEDLKTVITGMVEDKKLKLKVNNNV